MYIALVFGVVWQFNCSFQVFDAPLALESPSDAPLAVVSRGLNFCFCKTRSRQNKSLLRDMKAESPNMNYQRSKVKSALSDTWDAKYEEWTHKPGPEFRDDWIDSNTKRLINMVRHCAKALTEKKAKRQHWVRDIFFEGVADESEELPEPLGNPCGISAAVGCASCHEVLTPLNDPNNSGYCKTCAPAPDSQVGEMLDVEPSSPSTPAISGQQIPEQPPAPEHYIFGYSHERRQAFKTRLDKDGKALDTTYAKVFKGDDPQYVQAKFPESEPVAIPDLTLEEFKEIHALDPQKNTLFQGLVGGKSLKLLRSCHEMVYLKAISFYNELWSTSCCIMRYISNQTHLFKQQTIRIKHALPALTCRRSNRKGVQSLVIMLAVDKGTKTQLTEIKFDNESDGMKQKAEDI